MRAVDELHIGVGGSGGGAFCGNYYIFLVLENHVFWPYKMCIKTFAN